MKRLILFLSLLSLASPSLAYAKNSENSIKVRNGMYLSGALNEEKNTLYALGLGYIFTDTSTKFEEVSGTVGLGYAITPNVAIWGGITSYLDVESRTDPSVHTEQHPYQQIVWKMVNRQRLSISSITRFEERYAEDWKFRYHQSFNIEFTDSILNKYSPIFYNETRFSLGGNIAIPENRTFGGVSIPTGPRSKVEVGYLNQQLFGKESNTFVHNMVLNLRVSTG